MWQLLGVPPFYVTLLQELQDGRNDLTQQGTEDHESGQRICIACVSSERVGKGRIGKTNSVRVRSFEYSIFQAPAIVLVACSESPVPVRDDERKFSLSDLLIEELTSRRRCMGFETERCCRLWPGTYTMIVGADV